MNRLGNLNAKLKKKPYLYRIELLDRFYDLLDRKHLVFVKPEKWEDPLENLIFNAKVIKNGKILSNPAKDNIFAQCWSYEGDSYGIWQIYTTKANNEGITKRHMGVRITTKLSHLEQIVKKNKGHFHYGLVHYLWKYELDKLPKDPRIKKAAQITRASKEHLETLLIKRKSYAYEKEVRLFAIPEKNEGLSGLDFLCPLEIEPTEFISSLRLDPGMPFSVFKQHKERLVEEYGFRPTQITQSTYFRKNKYIIHLDE